MAAAVAAAALSTAVGAQSPWQACRSGSRSQQEVSAGVEIASMANPAALSRTWRNRGRGISSSGSGLGGSSAGFPPATPPGLTGSVRLRRPALARALVRAWSREGESSGRMRRYDPASIHRLAKQTRQCRVGPVAMRSRKEKRSAIRAEAAERDSVNLTACALSQMNKIEKREQGQEEKDHATHAFGSSGVGIDKQGREFWSSARPRQQSVEGSRQIRNHEFVGGGGSGGTRRRDVLLLSLLGGSATEAFARVDLARAAEEAGTEAEAAAAAGGTVSADTGVGAADPFPAATNGAKADTAEESAEETGSAANPESELESDSSLDDSDSDSDSDTESESGDVADDSTAGDASSDSGSSSDESSNSAEESSSSYEDSNSSSEKDSSSSVDDSNSREAVDNSRPSSSSNDAPAVTSSVFLDVAIDGAPAGRIVIGLYGNDVPLGAARFQEIARGQRGISFRRKEFLKLTPTYVQNGGLRSFSLTGSAATEAAFPGGTTADALKDELLRQQSDPRPQLHHGPLAVSIVVEDPSIPPPKEKLIARDGKLVNVVEESLPPPNGTQFNIVFGSSDGGGVGAPELDATSVVVGRVLVGEEAESATALEAIQSVPFVKENTSSPYFRAAKLIGDTRAVVAERGFFRPYKKIIVSTSGVLQE